jgi:hypothetical protein
MQSKLSFPCIALLGALAFLTGCSSPSYSYHYVPGRTAILINGHAIAPPLAPADVQAAIAAGNRIAGLPYQYGGGHGNDIDSGYDCSGSASFVLRAAGRLREPMASNEFRHYGESGEGKWITVFARRGHVFLSVAGLRFDTGWTRDSHGPQWTTQSRPADGCVLRHPAGL